MKKLLLIITILSGTLVSASAQYFNGNAAEPKFGIGIISGVTTGPFSSIYPEASGITLNFEYPIGSSPVSLLLSAGYTFYVSGGGYSIGYDNYGFGGSTYAYGSIASFVPIE